MAENVSRPTTLQNTWNGVVNEITQSGAAASAFTPQQRAYLKLARPLALVEGVAVLAVPNQYVKDFIETELAGTICQALSSKLGRSYTLAVTVDAEAASQQPQPASRPAEPPLVETMPDGSGLFLRDRHGIARNRKQRLSIAFIRLHGCREQSQGNNVCNFFHLV